MSGGASTWIPQRSRCEGARLAGGGAGAVSQTAAPVQTRGLAQSRAPVPVPPSHHQDITMTELWPLRDSIAFGALPGAVPCARLHTRLVLAEWGLPELIDNCELVVSELITNAVAASRLVPGAAAVRLWLLADENRVLIAVWDANPCVPVRTDVGDLSEHGRGLQLVDVLTTRWDTYPTPQHGGKIVRAICAATPPDL
jgi:anti-sigma regulatory factor (Ser/Thr protein kinase)